MDFFQPIFELTCSIWSEIHINIVKYSTRSSSFSDIALPLPRTQMFKGMLLFNGPKVWNSVPDNIRNSNNLACFKAMYKQYLL